MKKRLVIEFPPNAEILGSERIIGRDNLVISLPVQEVGPVFDGKALLEATRGISPAIVDSLCEDFTHEIEKQQLLSLLRIHQEEISEDKTQRAERHLAKQQVKQDKVGKF